jgi:CPA1 family monovalent cation:H+ antiporter
VALGLATGYLIGKLRDLLRHLHASEPLIETTLSLMTPYAAYLAAERLGVSGILAVVAAGLYSGWRDPVRMDAETRQTAFAVWTLVIFWLNGIAFVLLGLQFPKILAAVAHQYSTSQLIGFTSAVAGAAIAARLAWVFPGVYLPYAFRNVRKRHPGYSSAAVLVMGWAGMRGTVTLAAALSIPLVLPDGRPFPGRDIVIFLAFGVIAVTLLVQGTSLERLIGWLGIHGDDDRPKEELLARQTAVEAGLKTLRAMSDSATTQEMRASLEAVIDEYDRRLASLTAQGETRARARKRRSAGHHYRSVALHAERHALDDLWQSGAIIDEVYRPLQQLLDYEESLLRDAPPSENEK